jgi:hypothetical protein
MNANSSRRGSTRTVENGRKRRKRVAELVKILRT